MAPRRIDVGAVVQRNPAGGDLLGRHVRRRADELAGHRHARLLQHAGQAEVVDAQPAVGRQQQVGRLDVAVDDALLVGVIQGVGHLGDHARPGVEVAAARSRARRRSARRGRRAGLAT